MLQARYVKDLKDMEKITVSGNLRYYVDQDTGMLYFDSCTECKKLLNEEELAYGHDCEEE